MWKTVGCLVIESWQARTTELARPSRTMSISTSMGRVRPLIRQSLGGRPLVDWVLNRAAEAQLLDELVVLVPDTAEFDGDRLSIPRGVTVHRSTKSDPLARIVEYLDAAAEERSVSGIVRLRLECPLLDPCLIDRLVSSVRGADAKVDYATFRSNVRGGRDRLRALLQAQLGLFAEYISADSLRRVDQLLNSQTDREALASYIVSHPEEFALRLLDIPPALDRSDLRLVLRTQEDWDHAEQIVEALGEERLEWQGIVGLLRDHPVLRRRMASLNLAEVS